MMSRRENRNKLKRMKINDAANAIIYKQNIHSNRISAKIMPLHNISELWILCAIVSSFTHDNNYLRRIRIMEKNNIPCRVNMK